MPSHSTKAVWRSRLRWRLRGAMLWPAFALAVALDTVLLQVLPIAGEGRPDAVGAFLLAVFFNLVTVAVLAPLAGNRLRKRRPGTPKVVADDQAGTVLLALLAVALLALGLVHRPALVAEEDDFEAQSQAVRDYVAASGTAEYRAQRRPRRHLAPGPRPLPHVRAGRRPAPRAVPDRHDRPVAAGRHRRPRPAAQQPRGRPGQPGPPGPLRLSAGFIRRLAFRVADREGEGALRVGPPEGRRWRGARPAPVSRLRGRNTYVHRTPVRAVALPP